MKELLLLLEVSRRGLGHWTVYIIPRSKARRITIRFPADRDSGFYFRVYCWADDTLYPAIEMPGYGTIHNLERVRETVQITVLRHRKASEIMKLIQKTLPRHFPNCDPVIEGRDAIADGE